MKTGVVGRGAHLVIATSLVVAAAGPAAAQRPGSVELGGFATWTRFDNSLSFNDRFGAGGLLGIFFAKNVALEGDASYTKTHPSTGAPGTFSYVPIRGRLAAHLPLGSSYSRLILGAGYVAALYRSDLHVTNNGFTGLAGLLLGLSPHFALRADGIIDYLPSPFNEGPTVGSNVHYTARAGVSILLGAYPPNRDSIRADSIERAGRARADSVQRAEKARADSLQRAEQARADSIQRIERARADSVREAATTDSLRRVQQAHEDSLRLAQQAGQVDSMQMQLMLERKKNLVLEGVTFESNRARLTPDATKVLDFVAQSLQAHPEARVEIGGHTDARGSAALNKRLSLARAQAVRIYLIQRGVPIEQLVAVGYGKAQPVAPNNTEDGRARNRRVELRRIE